MATPNTIPTNAPSIYDTIKMLSTLDQQAILRPNNAPVGLAGFLFDMEAENTFELKSEITPHWIEDNTTIQDQIALNPEVYTVRGLIAELTDAPTTQAANQPTIFQPLPIIPDFVPELAPQAAQNEAGVDASNARDQSTAASAQSLYGYYNDKVGSDSSKSRQSQTLQYFYQLWKGRQLLSVETPWGYLTDMAIISIRVVQGEESKYVSDYTITLQKMRFAEEITVNVGQLAGRTAFQNADVTQNGVLPTTPLTSTQSESLLYKLSHPSP